MTALVRNGAPVAAIEEDASSRVRDAPDPEPPSAITAQLLVDYGHSLFWLFTRFVREVDDLTWLTGRLQDPKLDDHPLRGQAVRDRHDQRQQALWTCGDIVVAEVQSQRLWAVLSVTERVQHGCDAAWDVPAETDDLIGHVWRVWAPGALPDGWTLRAFLQLSEDMRPEYREYQRRGLIDTPIYVGRPSDAAKARAIRTRKTIDRHRSMYRT